MCLEGTKMNSLYIFSRVDEIVQSKYEISNNCEHFENYRISMPAKLSPKLKISEHEPTFIRDSQICIIRICLLN